MFFVRIFLVHIHIKNIYFLKQVHSNEVIIPLVRQNIFFYILLTQKLKANNLKSKLLLINASKILHLKKKLLTCIVNIIYYFKYSI